MRVRSKILIVDDVESQRAPLVTALSAQGYRVIQCSSGQQALKMVMHEHPDTRFVLTDLHMPEMDGTQLTKKLKEIDRSLEVVVMTAQGEIEAAVRAIQAGASNFLVKPIKLEELQIRLEKLEERRRDEDLKNALESENLRLRGDEVIVAQSGAMGKVLKDLEQAAQTESTVLLTGETGTGKEVLARFVHRKSRRSSEPFVAVNCSAVPEHLAESEFFGHEKGAFTGADRRMIGLFERAQGGTLFLDEVGDMDLRLQPKILRALEQKQIRRVGGEADIDVDVRVVAATHRNLKDAVADKTFREDLFFRLNVFHTMIPPLRDRREDIAPLVRHLVERRSRQMRGMAIQIDPSYIDALLKYPFPGNIRELANIVERSLIHTGSNGILHASSLTSEIMHNPSPSQASTQDQTSGPLPELLGQFEKKVIENALNAHSGDIAAVAEALKISRSSLYAKLLKHGIQH